MTDLDPEAMLRVIGELTRTVTSEYTDRPLRVEGSVPPAIDGVYFRNGAGRFERGGCRYAHPFDGDGHVTRLDIGPAGVRYTNRFVRTLEFVTEDRAGRMRYRAFGTNLPGGLRTNLFRLRFKNAANTSVRWHAGRLLALWEGGPPHRLDPATLATIGPESFDGRLRNPYPPPSRWLTPLLPFSAHPRLDPVSGDLFNFGLVAGSPNRLLIYRIGADGRMAPFREHAHNRFSFVHDFAVTERWFCFLLPHVDFDVTRAALGLRTPVGSLRIRSERPMQALLIPRDGGAPPAPVDCGTGFVFHIAQAFDRADGALALDVIRYGRYPDFDAFETLFRNADAGVMPRLERVVIDPGAGRSCSEPWTEHAAELPVSAPAPLGAPRRILYGVGAPPERRAPFLTSVLRLDTETGRLRSRDFGLDPVGEPMLVPDRNGGEGWLLTLVHRAGRGRSDLLILRAGDLATEAVAALPHVVPIGFHGCWVPRGELLARPQAGADVEPARR